MTAAVDPSRVYTVPGERPITARPVQAPDACVDYGLDWGSWLFGDVITPSSWSAPPGLTVVDDGIQGAVTCVGQRWRVGQRVSGEEHDHHGGGPC
jgi:hypothetical protein